MTDAETITRLFLTIDSEEFMNNALKTTDQAQDSLAARFKQEPQEFINLAMDTTHDSIYTYYEVRGPTKMVNQQIDQLLIRWHPMGYGTTVTRRARSDDERYAIAIVRRANSCD